MEQMMAHAPRPPDMAGHRHMLTKLDIGPTGERPGDMEQMMAHAPRPPDESDTRISAVQSLFGWRRDADTTGSLENLRTTVVFID